MVDKIITAFKSAEDKALHEIIRLREAREKISLGRAQAEQELAKLRQDLPGIDLARLLGESDTTSKSHREQIVDLQITVDASREAFGGLLQRIREAHESLRDSRAASLLRQADAVARERASLVKKFDVAMRQLEELVEAEFIPRSAYNRDLYRALGANGSAVSLNLPRARRPKTELLAESEAHLRARADQMQAVPLRESGRVEGGSVEAVVAELARRVSEDEMLIAPASSEVMAFFNPAYIEAAETAWHRSGASKSALGKEHPYTSKLELVWAAGCIDTAASRVLFVARPEPVFPGVMPFRAFPASAAQGKVSA